MSVPHPRRGERGLTLTEVLVAVAILTLLAGLTYPAFVLAKRSAALAPDTSNLRQIGVALALYTEQSGAPKSLDPLVDQGLLPARLLLSDRDPFGGYGGKLLACNRQGPKHPTSYDHLLDAFPYVLEDYAKVDPNYGLVALRVHGTPTRFMREMHSGFCRNKQFYYTGLLLRLANDGSVQRRHISIFDGVPSGGVRWRRAAMYVDNWQRLERYR